MYKDDIKIGDLFLQKGFRRVNRKDGKIFSIDYVDDIAKLGNSYSVDNSGINAIYQLYGYDMDGYKIKQFESYGFSFELDNMSLEEINNRFISLFDFLKDATFVGREFRRTKPVYRFANVPINTGFVRGINRRFYLIESRDRVKTDRSFMNSNEDGSKYIVLYEKDNIFLVRNINNNNCFSDEYMIIGCNYTCDGNYEFFGDVYEEYMDREKVYLGYLEQINGYNKKKYVKTRKR